MKRMVRRGLIICAWSALPLASLWAQEAILSQGDPRLQQSDGVAKDRQEEIRKNRLKQQGQGENYRVEGELQGGSKGPTSHPKKGHDRQATGIEDPSVNPGQAAGLKTIRGRVLKSEEQSLTVEIVKGKVTTFTVDPETKLTTQLRPGDRVTATVTNQGRAVTVHKEDKSQPSK
jgi:hypothetical protein